MKYLAILLVSISIITFAQITLSAPVLPKVVPHGNTHANTHAPHHDDHHGHHGHHNKKPAVHVAHHEVLDCHNLHDCERGFWTHTPATHVKSESFKHTCKSCPAPVTSKNGTVRSWRLNTKGECECSEKKGRNTKPCGKSFKYVSRAEAKCHKCHDECTNKKNALISCCAIACLIKPTAAPRKMPVKVVTPVHVAPKPKMPPMMGLPNPNHH